MPVAAILRLVRDQVPLGHPVEPEIDHAPRSYPQGQVIELVQNEHAPIGELLERPVEPVLVAGAAPSILRSPQRLGANLTIGEISRAQSVATNVCIIPSN